MPRRLRFRFRRSNQGYTLLEMLVVVLIIAILFALAAPGWAAFMSNQRVSQAGNQLAQTVRNAQAVAKRTRTTRIVRFDTAADPPRVAVVPMVPDSNPPTPIPDAQISNWETLGNGEIRSGLLQMTATNLPAGNYVAFDSNGNLVVPQTSVTVGSNTFLFQVRLFPRLSVNNRRCVIGQTLLGTVRDASGSDCP